MAKLPKEQQQQIEAQLVEQGELLPDREAKAPGKPRRKIDSVISELIEKTRTAKTTPADRLAELEAAIGGDAGLLQQAIDRLQLLLSGLKAKPARSRLKAR
jgi:hypothetical protein